MSSPKVTVLLPVHNGERFIREAVRSVLDQTYHDFEFLILDDCSTDQTPQILTEFTDSRIRIVRNEKNLQLIGTLNRGLDLSRGEFIARMDADDVCHPKRLEKQVEFLERHPDVAVVGSDITIFENDIRSGFRPLPPPTSSAQIRWELLRVSCLYHPTVVMRRSIFATEKPYDPKYTHCEDYELWLRLSRQHRLANINEPLLYYRRHLESITVRHGREQRLHAERALAHEIERRVGRLPSPTVTGLLMEPRRIKEISNLFEFRDIFSKLLEEMLNQPQLTTQDRVYIRLSATTTMLRLLIPAIRFRPSLVPELIFTLIFDLKLDFPSALRLPTYIGQTIARRWGIWERLQSLKH